MFLSPASANWQKGCQTGAAYQAKSLGAGGSIACHNPTAADDDPSLLSVSGCENIDIFWYDNITGDAGGDADGTAAIPVSIRGAQETGATTLAQGGMMCAVSNISVAAGTSTAVTPFNLNMTSAGIVTGATCAQAYTGNGTDPLTAGNYLELARVSSVIDADAATTGIVPPSLSWNIGESVAAPLIQDIGSLLFYGEAAANTLYVQMIWAELPETFFQ